MGTFFAYNLKLSVCFLLFYLLYKGVLCRNTFHRTNRIVLLSAYLFILFVPLIPLTTTQPVEIQQIIGVSELWLLQAFYSPVETTLHTPVWNWAHLAVIIYAAGVLFFTLRYVYFLLRITLRIRSGEKIRMENNITLVISEKNTTPFSWMHYIVLSKTDDAQSHNVILPHEQAHVERRHSIDLLIADLLAIIQWYNPAIWLMKNELQDVHEYEADEATLHSGVNAKEYQLLLIEKAVGSPCFNSMTNSLNHSKLKKRITMMLKQKNSRWARLKYLSILPLAALAVTLFARPEVSNKLDEISAVKVSDFTSIGEVNTESFAGVQETPVKEKSKQKQVKPATTADSLEIVHRLKEWEEFFKTTSPEEFKEMMKQAQKTDQRTLIFNGGRITNLEHFSDTAFTKQLKGRIKLLNDSVLVFNKQTDSLNLYLNRFMNDSVLLQIQRNLQNDSLFTRLKNHSLNLKFDFDEKEFLEQMKNLDKRMNKIRIGGLQLNTGESPLILLDNKEISDPSVVNSNDIESITVLKDSTSAAIYGAKGVHGVISITTKKGVYVTCD